MKALLAVAVLCLASLSVSAQQPPQQCGPVEVGTENLLKNFDEHVLFTGAEEGGFGIILYFNQTTGTWTLVMAKGGLGCMLKGGIQGRAAPPKGGDVKGKDM